MKAINLEYLKQLMAENAMDVKQLAKAANINLRSAKGILDGSVSRPTKSTVTRLADAFGVSAESLVFEVERAAQPPKPEPLPETKTTEAVEPDEPDEVVAERDRIAVRYVKPDFILINKDSFGVKQPTLVSTASITCVSIDSKYPKIWYRRSIGDSKEEVLVEVFDDDAARNERWSALLEFLCVRGILG